MDHHPILVSPIAYRLQEALIECRSRGFDVMYISVDLHGTVIRPDYTRQHQELQFYDGAEDVLRLLSGVKRFKLIMYTCSWPDEIVEYRRFFESRGIRFDHVNRNPEADDTKYDYYHDKHYTNLLLDDKAGFVATQTTERCPFGLNDWAHIRFALRWMLKQASDGDEPVIENWGVMEDYLLTPEQSAELRDELSGRMEYYFKPVA